MDMREFLRSHDTSRKASHADARADEDEVKKCGLKFLSVPTVDEAPVPRHLVQKYSNLESNRKEWLESMQDNVNLLVTERTKRLALARAKFMGSNDCDATLYCSCVDHESMALSLSFHRYR